MTNEELQAAISLINSAYRSGQLQYLNGGKWADFHVSTNGEFLNEEYRIKPQPREVFIAVDDIPKPGCAGPNCYVMAGDLATYGWPKKFAKFREVIE